MKKFTLLLALFIAFYFLPGCAQRTNSGRGITSGYSYLPFIYDSYGRIVGKMGFGSKYGLYYYNPYYDLYFPYPYYYNSYYYYPYSPYSYYYPYYNVYPSGRNVPVYPPNYKPRPRPSNPAPAPPPSYKPPPPPRPSPPPPRSAPPPPARQLKSSSKKELE